MVRTAPVRDEDCGSPLGPPEAELEAAVTGRDEAMQEEERGDDERPDFCCFDIETGPQPDKQLAAMMPDFLPDPPPGEFDPSAVKTGNLKDPAKIKDKIESARSEHATRVASYAADVERAKADHKQAFIDKAALDATTGRLVAIGWHGVCENGVPQIIDCSGDREEEGLRKLWYYVGNCLADHVPMVGFNLFHFDLPFLVRRSWILGVPVPSGVRVGRYWSDLFIDLMAVWQQGGRELVSLDTLAKAFGVAGKVHEVDGVPVEGKTFYKLWESNRPVAEAYLRADMRIPAELARRMGAV